MKVILIIFLVFSLGCASSTWWQASEYAKTNVRQGINECTFEANKASAQGGYHGGGLANALAADTRTENVFKSCMVAKGFYEIDPPEENRSFIYRLFN